MVLLINRKMKILVVVWWRKKFPSDVIHYVDELLIAWVYLPLVRENTKKKLKTFPNRLGILAGTQRTSKQAIQCYTIIRTNGNCRLVNYQKKSYWMFYGFHHYKKWLFVVNHIFFFHHSRNVFIFPQKYKISFTLFNMSYKTTIPLRNEINAWLGIKTGLVHFINSRNQDHYQHQRFQTI